MKQYDTHIAIIGAGIVGIATAYYVKRASPDVSVLLIDAATPMALTSAQSGENYRNWWPHPTMTAFTDRSIDLMEEISRETDNLINMNRRGYALTTRSDNTDTLMEELHYGYSQLQNSEIRIHNGRSVQAYHPPNKPDWELAPTGVDVISDQTLIRKTFPSYDRTIKTVVHIRRAGAISAQQMGQYMVQQFKNAGGVLLNAQISSIDNNTDFTLHTTTSDTTIKAQKIVNAAGPYLQQVAAMTSDTLPIHNTLQQKIAFEDTANAIPREMPFSIDLDAQTIDWTEEEHQLLFDSDEHKWLTQEMTGAIHCRPEGGDNGSWLKLGWAFNNTASEASRTPELMDSFPEIVLRGAARLNPSLKHYCSQMPASIHHYGGYYTLTEENWPLVGPTDTQGVFVVGAMSGFGTMAACAAGELCALHLLGSELPHYAEALSPHRYKNPLLMAELNALSQRGIL